MLKSDTDELTLAHARDVATIYPNDLTDEEWAHIEPLFPPGKPGGGKRRVHIREVVNGVMYLLSTSCQWRAFLHPPRKDWLALGDGHRLDQLASASSRHIIVGVIWTITLPD